MSHLPAYGVSAEYWAQRQLIAADRVTRQLLADDVYSQPRSTAATYPASYAPHQAQSYAPPAREEKIGSSPLQYRIELHPIQWTSANKGVVACYGHSAHHRLY